MNRLAGIGRLFVFFLVLFLPTATWWTRQARAEMARGGIQIGKDLAPLADLLEGQHAILLNGEELALASHTTDQPVNAVLDRFAAHCRENAGAVSELWSDVARGNRLDPKETAALLSDLAVVRDEEDGEGIVLCLAKNGDASPAAALRAFAETRDIGALGKLRYVYARPDGAGRTHVMTVWTDRSFRLDRVMSEAEGRLPEDPALPRPPASRFLFDARVRESPYAVRVYRSTASPSEAVAFYDREMQGWDIVTMPVPGGETRGYVKDGVQFVVGASRDADSGDTLVSLTELGARRTR